MSNHHFKNKNLSLKAKGLLSLMLSLPDDWNYNMKGLATLSKDGIDSVRTAMKELENQGYVEKDRSRNEAGCYQGTVYTVILGVGICSCFFWCILTYSIFNSVL